MSANPGRARALLDGLDAELRLLVDDPFAGDRDIVVELEELAAMARVIRRELDRLYPAP